MNTIPIEQIDAAWGRMNQITETEVRQMAQRAQEEQPYIMVYLLAMDENIMDESERGRLMELGAIILEIMYEARPDLRQVTDRDLAAAEEANTRFLQEVDEESEMHQTGMVGKALNEYNQGPLLGAILEALMCGNEDEPEHAPENIGLALLYLKTVIDCLDQ